MNDAPLRPATVDLATETDAIAALHTALKSHGFVAVRNTAVSDALRSRAFASARTYFAQSEAMKNKDAYRDTNANFGYQGMLSEALNPQQTADLKEAFTMRSLNRASQVTDISSKSSEKHLAWAAQEFGATATELYDACSSTALRLLELIAQALGAPADIFETFHTGENMTLRYLHYPALEGFAGTEAKTGNAVDPTNDELSTGSTHSGRAKSSPNEKKMPQLGAGAHTDYGTITLLFSDGVAGLQLFDVSSGSSEGRWRDVEVAPGDVLVNTGDLMSLWSNGLYPSTLHRVQPRFEKPDRYSMAFFVDPDSSTRVSPLPSCVERNRSEAHPTSAKVVVAGEHIQARIEASQRTLA